jgi:hypothetical protein
MYEKSGLNRARLAAVMEEASLWAIPRLAENAPLFTSLG